MVSGQVSKITVRIIVVFYLTGIFLSCTDQAPVAKAPNAKAKKTHHASPIDGLKGVWIKHDKGGFTLVDFKDDSTILYYQFFDRTSERYTVTQDRYWLEKANAQLGFWDSTTIAISTGHFRFDYKVHGDTLQEYDKMGDQGKLIRMYTDEEKRYRIFNASNLKGEITHLDSVGPTEYFILNNQPSEFAFVSTPDSNTQNKIFVNLAVNGDSVIKIPFSDTLTFIKKDTRKSYRFGFRTPE